MKPADRPAADPVDADSKGSQISRVPADTVPSEGAERAWEMVLAAAEDCFERATFAMWIKPAVCVGESNGAICVETPEPVTTWIERRYGKWLGDATRHLTDYRGLFIGTARPEKTSETGML